MVGGACPWYILPLIRGIRQEVTKTVFVRRSSGYCEAAELGRRSSCVFGIESCRIDLWKMPLVPFLDVCRDMRWPVGLREQRFGVTVLAPFDPSDVPPLRGGYYRPWRCEYASHSGVSHKQHDTEGFKVNLDVQQFKPDELTVKTVNNFVVVEGKHEERQDEHGFISRQFQRRYKLPSDIEADTVVSQLSSDGVLTIFAPKKALLPPAEERIVPISHTETPALKLEKSKTDEA